MKLLEVADLRVDIATAAGSVQAVRGVDLELAAGQTLALVGESGCGKSITALSLLGLAPGNSRITGSVSWRGRQLLGMRDAAMRRLRGVDIALIGQNPMAALNPIQRVGEQIAEMLMVHRNWSRRRAWRRAIELLGEMQLPEPARQARQFPFEFSGGMLQRVAIAMAVACEPQLLIADEPTTALDVTVQAQVLGLLGRLREERGMALLLITHDLGVVAQMADRVAVMYAGEIVESAAVESLFGRRGHPYSTGLKQALPERVHRGEPLASIAGLPPDLLNPPVGCSFRARCPHAMAICTEGRVPIFRLTGESGGKPEAEPEGSHASRCWLHHPDCPAESRRQHRQGGSGAAANERLAPTVEPLPLLRVEGLARYFPLGGGRRSGVLKALDGVDFELRRGEVLGVVGESGSGKSTLGKTLLGLHDKTAGQVWLKGQSLPARYDRADFLRYSGVLQMVFQDPYATLNPRLTVGASLAEPLRIRGRQGQVEEWVAAALGRVGLSAEAAGRYPHEFSGGQRQRIGIARALIADPEILVCDEPVSALDVSVQAQIVNLLRGLRAELGLAMVFIAHDLALVRYLCDRLLVMYRGRVVEEGPVEAVFERPAHPYTRLLLDSSPVADPALRNPNIGGPASNAGDPNSSSGCAFASRCPRAQPRCRQDSPVLMPYRDGRSACFFPLD